MKEQDREYVEKRKKENNEKLLKLKEFIRKKPPETNYLYQKENSNYINKENNLVKMENIKRKAIMKHIDLKEFDEMRKNFEIIKTKKMKESNEKMKLMKNSWSQRFKLIPLYVNPIGKLASEEENKMKQEEQNKIEKRKKLKEIKEQYKPPKPQKKIIEKIAENENGIGNGNGGEKKIFRKKPNLIKSNSYSDMLRQNMLEKYRILQNKKEKMKQAELLPDEDYYLDEPELSKKILENIKKCEKYNKNDKINQSFEKNKNNDNKKKKKKEPFDYLKERRKINEMNREKKRNAGELTNMGSAGTNDIKKIIKENNGLNDNALKLAKCKLESLEEKKRQKDLLLKCTGGVGNKPELGEEVGDLMIDSIQAKLSLIKELDKSLDDSIKEEKKDKNNINNDRYSIQENTEEHYNDEDENN